MDDLDELLESAVLEAALAGGRDPRLAARQFGAARVIAAGPGEAAGDTQANVWTAADEAFLREWAGVLGDAEIAVRLGRSETAVRVRSKRLGLPSPSNHPAYITGHRMARALGIDVHQVCDLIERGLLPAELAPLDGRRTWRMRRTAFHAWAVNPANWVYFIRSVRRPERLRDEKLRRLIARRVETWGDAWWTTAQTAAHHGVDHTDVMRYIDAGRLPAVKWHNWWVLRSEATRPGLRFYKGKGEGHYERHGTSAGDAFIVLAAAVGIPFVQIGRMTGRGGHAGIQSRYAAMRRRGLVPWLIRAYGLPVECAADGTLWADWRAVAHRFPLVARAWARWERGERLSGGERYALAGVLRAAVIRAEGPDSPLAVALGRGMPGTAQLDAARAVWERTAAGPR